MTKDTETLDKLYLEWSQFTTARTKRECELIAAVNAVQSFLDNIGMRSETEIKRIQDYLKKLNSEYQND